MFKLWKGRISEQWYLLPVAALIRMIIIFIRARMMKAIVMITRIINRNDYNAIFFPSSLSQISNFRNFNTSSISFLFTLFFFFLLYFYFLEGKKIYDFLPIKRLSIKTEGLFHVHQMHDSVSRECGRKCYYY